MGQGDHSRLLCKRQVQGRGIGAVALHYIGIAVLFKKLTHTAFEGCGVYYLILRPPVDTGTQLQGLFFVIPRRLVKEKIKGELLPVHMAPYIHDAAFGAAHGKASQYMQDDDASVPHQCFPFIAFMILPTAPFRKAQRNSAMSHTKDLLRAFMERSSP